MSEETDQMLNSLIREKVEDLNRCVRLAQQEGIGVSLGLLRINGEPAHTEVTVTTVARPLEWLQADA